MEYKSSKTLCLDSMLYMLGYGGGSMSAGDIEEFSNFYSRYLDCTVLSSSWDCECCGIVYDYDIDISNKKGKNLSYSEDGHFGSGELPMHEDLYMLILEHVNS